jgi:uncharacterized membrane protein YeiH
MEQIQIFLNDLTTQKYFNLMIWNHVFIVSTLVFESFGGTKSKNEPPFLVGFILSCVLGTGGSIISNTLLARPHIYFDHDIILGSMFVAWTFIAFFPYHLVYYLVNIWFIKVC